MLAMVAMLVDYYRSLEAFDLIAPLWIEAATQSFQPPHTMGATCCFECSSGGCSDFRTGVQRQRPLQSG
jgi:hypothetical protein